MLSAKAVRFVTWVLCFPCFNCLSLASSFTIIAAVPCAAVDLVYLKPKESWHLSSPGAGGLQGSGPCWGPPSLWHPEPCSCVPCSMLVAGCQVWLFCSIASTDRSCYSGYPSLTDLPIHCLCWCCRSGPSAPSGSHVLPSYSYPWKKGLAHSRPHSHMHTHWLSPTSCVAVWFWDLVSVPEFCCKILSNFWLTWQFLLRKKEIYFQNKFTLKRSKIFLLV